MAIRKLSPLLFPILKSNLKRESLCIPPASFVIQLLLRYNNTVTIKLEIKKMASATEYIDADSFDCVEFDSSKLSSYENLPTEMWENIFLRLKYEKICELKLVCKMFNQIGKTILEKAKTKVETKLAQHVEFSKSQLLTFGIREPNFLKYIILYLVDKSRDNLCNLFRKLIGKNAECFTLGKMIDFLIAFFVVLEGDKLFDCQNLDFLHLLEFWRTTYDKHQMKQMGAFDFCLFMWLKTGELNSSFCNPAELFLLPAEKTQPWRNYAERAANSNAWNNILSVFYGCYNYSFKLDDNIEVPEKYLKDEKDYGSVALLSNEHWTPYKPPDIILCVALCRKYLFQHLKSMQ